MGTYSSVRMLKGNMANKDWEALL